MRCLNEAIARQANQEDHCTGRFWEGRFKSQVLLDEKALAACLAYVDLNPARATMAAETPEESDYTSVQQRIRKALSPSNADTAQPSELMPFAGNPRTNMPKGLPFRLSDCLERVDWTGRQLREGKRGAINETLPPILQRLQIDPKHCLPPERTVRKSLQGAGRGGPSAPNHLCSPRLPAHTESGRLPGTAHIACSYPPVSPIGLTPRTFRVRTPSI